MNPSPALAKDVSSARDLPWWRVAEILAGIARAKCRLRCGGLRRFPVLHAQVKLRRARGRIEVGHLSEIHERVVLSAMGLPGGTPARIVIGDHTSIWYGTVISARHAIRIGSHCAISWNCTIVDDDMHHLEFAGGATNETDPARPGTEIGDHVWLGAGVIVLKGVSIGAGSVVAAGSVVRSDLPPGVLAAGTPARVLKEIRGWR